MSKSVIYSTIIGRSEMPFQIFIGARGLGKTYSALAHYGCRETHGNMFMLLRRTDAEIQSLCSEYSHPFKVINQNEGTDIYPEFYSKERYGIFYKTVGDENIPVGYGCALSTFAKMRGVNFEDVDTIIFDECIPEKHVHKMRGEGEAFLHMYESVNRNREFDGKDPVRVYLLGNSINLNNPILLSLGIVSIIADMMVKGRQKYTDKRRGIYIELMVNKDFTDRKGETALYNLTRGTDFSEQALNNKFTEDDFTPIEKVPLNEYKPMFTFGAYTVFVHKSNGDLYICKKKSSGVLRYEECDRDIMYWRFSPRYRQMVLARMVRYDDYGTKLVFDALTSRN